MHPRISLKLPKNGHQSFNNRITTGHSIISITLTQFPKKTQFTIQWINHKQYHAKQSTLTLAYSLLFRQENLTVKEDKHSVFSLKCFLLTPPGFTATPKWTEQDKTEMKLCYTTRDAQRNALWGRAHAHSRQWAGY